MVKMTSVGQIKPLVSIVIPVFNGADYLNQAIDSALAQTYKNIEIIVVNDGSTDGGKTEEIARTYGERIRYFWKENGGVATALNYGIDKMQGEYFSWLSHDDVYYPDKVEKQVDLLIGLKDKKTIIYSGLEIIDGDGQLIETHDYAKQYKEKELNCSLFAFFHLILNGCTMLIHKSHFQRVGMFDTELPTTQDYDLWFRLLRGNEIAYANHVLVKSRSHQNQESKANFADHVKECNVFWLRVFSSLTDDEIINTGDSRENFFADLYNSFRTLTSYGEVIAYLYAKFLDEFLHKFYDEQDPEKRNNMMKMISGKIYEDQEHPGKTVPKVLSYCKKKKPRVIFFTAVWWDRGGLNRVISRVSSLLSPHYEVFVLCMREAGNENGYKLDPRVNYLELEEREFLLIPSLLKLLDADVFIGSNNCFVPLINMYKEIESLGIRVIMWNHENYFLPYLEDNLNETVLVRNQVFKDVSVVLWLTKYSARMGRLFGERVGVISNPLSFSLGVEYRREDKNLNIISLARFDSPRKRLDRLILVFGEVIKRIPDAKLYIVGTYDLKIQVPGPRRETISDLIEKLKIPKENIIFTGEVTNVEEYYSKAAVNIITSESEGFGLTLIESALFGIPSVVFNGGSMSDIISSGKNGFVVEDDDIKQMADKIVLLLTDDILYTKMSESARIMADSYKDEVILDKWMLLIDAVRTLDRQDLSEFLRDNFLEAEDKISLPEFRDIVKTYEGVVKSQLKKVYEKDSHLEKLTKQQLEMKERYLEEINRQESIIYEMENSLSWKMTKPFRKFHRLIDLIRLHGLRITIWKVVLKITGMVTSLPDHQKISRQTLVKSIHR